MTEITVRFDLSFSRRFLTTVGAAAIMLCAVPELDSESVTLSTYYPAPSGVYTNMITTGNTFLARDGGAVAIGTVVPVANSKLTVVGGSIAGNYGITPRYAGWAAYGVGDGGAAIYNDSGAYQGLMLVGNNSGGALRRVKVWDEMTVNGSMRATAAIVSLGPVCAERTLTLGVTNCLAGQYATYTAGIMVKKTFGTATTDPGGTMLCCPCPADGCPSL